MNKNMLKYVLVIIAIGAIVFLLLERRHTEQNERNKRIIVQGTISSGNLEVLDYRISIE
jgi:hypothetical protein